MSAIEKIGVFLALAVIVVAANAIAQIIKPTFVSSPYLDRFGYRMLTGIIVIAIVVLVMGAGLMLGFID